MKCRRSFDFTKTKTKTQDETAAIQSREHDVEHFNRLHDRQEASACGIIIDLNLTPTLWIIGEKKGEKSTSRIIL
jgi:hypothetical protein